MEKVPVQKTPPQPVDPRVKASTADLATQFELSRLLCDLRGELGPIGRTYESLGEKLKQAKARAAGTAAEQPLAALEKKLQELAPPEPRRGNGPLSLQLLDQAKRLFDLIQEADAAPAPRVQKAVAEVRGKAPSVLARWRGIISQDVPALNAQLQASNLPPIDISSADK